jgi:hypothetical protein
VLGYNELCGAQLGREFTRKLNRVTFAFQAHNPNQRIAADQPD